MMIAGIKILFCLGFALAADNGVGDPNQAPLNWESIRRQVERQRMSAMEPNQTTGADSLKQIVTQLQTLQVLTPSPQPSVTQPAGQKLNEENKTSAASLSGFAAMPSSAGGHKESVAAAAVGLDKVEKPLNPMATADALYRAKNYSGAVRFYQMAAGAASKADPEGCQWALYQTANCLRYEDAEKAIAAYQRLLTEFPSSSWAAAAQIQQRNLEWFKKKQTVLPKTKLSNDPNQ